VKPVLQALVLAEHVYQDVSGKKVIAGTFNQLWFTRKTLTREVKQPDGTTHTLIPGGMQGGSPFAYISLTDVCAGTELSLHFVNLTENRILIRSQIKLQGDSQRLSTVEVVVPLPMLPIQTEGVYAFEVVCEGEILGSYRIMAKEMKLEEGA
jgi:hypothetical protein